MAELKAPKAIIFDWDNTLVDTWPIIHKALNKTFVKYGITPWTFDETRERVAHSLRDSFPRLFGDQWEEAGKVYQMFYQNHHLQELESLPLSEDVLKFLKEKGIYVAVVSNKKGPTLRKEVEFIGWGEYFNKLIGSNDTPRDKPFADPVHMALEGSGIIPGEDVWFVGDTTIDLECAKNTTCVPILYGKADTGVLESQASGVRYGGFDVHCHVPTHEELLSLLRHTF